MSDDDQAARLARIRREPPPLQPVTVVERVELTPRMLRLTFEGDGLRELTVDQPAASVRLLVPSPGSDELVIPAWNGNEFLLPGGERPALRTFTPLRVDNDAGRLDIEVVRHPGGAVSEWAERAAIGAPAAISGPGTGYTIPVGADRLVVFGDETALPAMTQLIGAAPLDVPLELHVEVIDEAARYDVGVRDVDTVEWYVSAPGSVPGRRLVDAIRSIDELTTGTQLWAAGEASAMHAIRTHLFDTLGLPRRSATVRGYWKPERVHG